MVEIKIGEVKVGEKTTPSPTPTPKPPTPKSPSEWLDEHIKVVNKVNEYARLGKCVTADRIALDLNLDVEVVKTHLELIAIDKGAVKVADVQGQGVYCPVGLINKFIEDLKSL